MAEIIPMGMATTPAIRRAINANSNVMGNRFFMSPQTGWS